MDGKYASLLDRKLFIVGPLLMDPIANYGNKAVTGYCRSIQLYNMQHRKMVNDAIEKFLKKSLKSNALGKLPKCVNVRGQKSILH